MDLTVVSVCANEKGLVGSMIDSVFTFTPFKVPIILVNNGNSVKILKRMQEIHKDKIQIVRGAITKGSTSVRHGNGLNIAMKYVNTKYTAIIESDCCVLSPEWYKFDTSKYNLVAPYKGQRDIPYWYVCFCIFETRLFKNMNWSPAKRNDPGYNDVGWNMYGCAEKDKIENLSIIRCAGRSGSKVFKNFSHKSMEIYNPDKVLVAAHFFRGSDMSRRGGDDLLNGREFKRWIETYNQVKKEYLGK